MMQLGLILAFSLILLLGIGALTAIGYGIRESRRFGQDLLVHWEKGYAQKVVLAQQKAQTDAVEAAAVRAEDAVKTQALVDTMQTGLEEMRALSESAIRMSKATNLHEAAQVEMAMSREAVNLEQMKDALAKEDSKIPVKKPKLVKDLAGRTFDMDELEAL